jgi:hypothetical protein
MEIVMKSGLQKSGRPEMKAHGILMREKVSSAAIGSILGISSKAKNSQNASAWNA